jgi:hypothetical protein
MITDPQTTDAIVDENGVMTQRFRTWTQQVTQTQILIGTGSPEGSVEAGQGALYMDETGGSSLLYIKKDANVGGDKALGWVLV